MKTGVVIPCYNNFDTLNRAIDSAADADQIVVVIDGSWFLADESKCTFVFTQTDFPVGVCGTRNYGIEMLQQMQCELIIPLDADDYFRPGGIGALRSAWQPGTWVYGGYEYNDQLLQAPPSQQLRRKNVSQATICFHVDDWAKAGGYDPDFNVGSEDYAFTLALTQIGVRGVRISDYIYHWSENGRRAKRVRRYGQLIKTLLKDKYPEVYNAKSSR